MNFFKCDNHGTIIYLDCKICVISESGKPDEAVPEDKKINFKRECIEEQDKLKMKFKFFNKLSLMNFGQITVHRLKIECECTKVKDHEVCAKFLPKDKQRWPSFLGHFGNGVFLSRP